MHLPVPNLTTASIQPLESLEKTLLENQIIIESWFRQEWQKTPAPFYASIDLRNSGFKLAPIDTNLFPAGFNNLNPEFDPLSIQAIQTTLEQKCPQAKNILLVPENHSRNTFYFENLKKIHSLITRAGYNVKIGTLPSSTSMPESIPNTDIAITPIEITANRIHIGDFFPCLILLNNDLSDGYPRYLDTIEQTIVPPPKLGWSSRLKSSHFSHFSQAALEFSEIINIESWLIDPYYKNCGEIDFKLQEGKECLERHTRTILQAIQVKYNEYGIKKKPFVIIKADSGTYGMGVMTIHDPAEISTLNRKQRNKMTKSKGGNEISRVIIQEGVYTNETVGENNAVAEPVIYHIDHFVVGGFYRVHQGRSVNQNLNAPGAHFEQLAFAKTCTAPDCHLSANAQPNRFYAYGVISRLALLAAAREIHAISPIITEEQAKQ